MLSVIVPAFNEQENLLVLYQRLSKCAQDLPDIDFEFIFIDDCSTDQTPVILNSLFEKDKRIKVIRFSRNCGSHAALAAGLNFCKGDAALSLAADLQDPPEIMAPMIKKWQNGAKTVWAVRTKREKESFSVKLFSRVYYGLINFFTDVRMPPLGSDVFMIDRVVIEAFRAMPEKHSSIYMALAWLGFSQATVDYVKQAREAGSSKWTLRKKIKLIIDSLLSFSDVFIRSISIVGFVMALLGFAYAFSIIMRYFLFGIPSQGWSSLIVAIFVLGGIQMMMLGILGEYLWRTFDESRKRPQFVIESLRGIDSNR